MNVNPHTPTHNSQTGGILIYAVIIIFVLSLVLVTILSNAAIQMRVIRSTVNRELAFQVAEAGANYYQWRMAHFPTDYADGTGQTGCGPCGPYVHDYIDKDTNQKVGEYSLTIEPPPAGSTIATIHSTGYSVANPSIRRTVTVRYGIPSLAKYAFLTNGDVYIGEGTTISGEMHANGGIHFEGTTNALVNSSKPNIPPGPGYQCQPYHGCSSPYQWKPGVWGNEPPSITAYWRMGEPNVDFSGVTADFQTMEQMATGQADLPPSNAQGYSLVFNANGTVSVYKVNSLRAHATGYDVNGDAHAEDLDYNTRTFQYTMSIPANGVIFVKDHVWVEGTVNGRVVVAATKYSTNSSQQARILIPNNLRYLAKDGNHVLGLIAEKDVLLTFFVPADLEINAAMFAQKGSYQRYNFSGSLKNTLTVYGAVGSFGTAATHWTGGGGDNGFPTRYTTYDANLLYSPPPAFPISSEGYRQISWESD